MIGQKFNRLLVVAKAPSVARAGGGTRAMWRCRCDCGAEVVVRSQSIRKGHTRSCGCLHRTHGHAKAYNGGESPTHRSWRSMKDRCLNPRHVANGEYAARGLSERWHKFENFLEDMGERPSLKHSIERIDNSKGYEPGNCKWATAKEQQRNTSQNRLVHFRGREMTVAEAAELVGINRYLVYKRLERGWATEKALSLVDHRSIGGRLAVA